MTSPNNNILFENLITPVVEDSDCYVLAQFVDIFGALYTPVNVKYGIKSLTYNQDVVPEWAQFSGTLATNITIVIPASLNVPLGSARVEQRQVALQITAPGGAIRYDSRIYALIKIRQVP